MLVTGSVPRPDGHVRVTGQIVMVTLCSFVLAVISLVLAAVTPHPKSSEIKRIAKLRVQSVRRV